MESLKNRTTMQHISHTSPSSGCKGISANNNSSSTKMGSRRIFTPQFKLQVLESYRNDNDCKGNQRATARKYNIHRRQIQKWLQCESSLRSSVANINHNSVKHQFHNVCIQQQPKSVAITSHCIGNTSSYKSSQCRSKNLCLELSRGSHNAIKVPMPNCGNASSTQGTSNNLFDSTINEIASCANTLAVPSETTSANRATNTSISPIFHHHQHFGIPPYTCSTPSSIPSTSPVAILAHTSLPNHQPHIHEQNYLPHHTSYQYHHNMTYYRHQTEKQRQSYINPVINPPIINALSVVASNNYNDGSNEIGDNELQLNFISMEPKTTTQIDSYSLFYERNDSIGAINTSNMNIPFSLNKFKEDLSYSAVYPFLPIDLSIRHRREVQSSEIVSNAKANFQNTENKKMGTLIQNELNSRNINVVDLTYRKRSIADASHSTDSDFTEKHPKLCKENSTLNTSVSHVTITLPNSTDEDDVEIEVGDEDIFLSPSSKPVKLFKPYLLDECDNKLSKDERNKKQSEINATNCFSQYVSKTINNPNDNLACDNVFPDISKESPNTTCVDSLNFFVESRSESPRSSCSPITFVPTTWPRNFQYPKGSPASSGYESSTSTYSDSSSLSSKHELHTYRNYNIKLQTIYNENTHIMHPSKNVQRWLETDNSNPLVANPSIALLV